MLDGHVRGKDFGKCLVVRSGSADFDCFLQHLLRSWGFSIGDPSDPETLLLAGDGIEVDESRPLIRLTASHYHGRDRLGLPLKFEELWQTLEHRFHRPPRMHIRMAIELPARIVVRGRSFDTTLSSLSDMGARFLYPEELVRDERVVLHFAIPGIQPSYDGCVIFAAPHNGLDGDGYRIGVVFHGLKRVLRDELRHYLIQRYLSHIQPQMSPSVFEAGLANLDLPPALRQRLTP